MLKADGEIAHGARELGLDPVAVAARGRGMMGLVQNQKTSREERTQPLTQWVCVSWVDQEVVRYQKAAVPWTKAAAASGGVRGQHTLNKNPPTSALGMLRGSPLPS